MEFVRYPRGSIYPWEVLDVTIFGYETLEDRIAERFLENVQERAELGKSLANGGERNGR